MAIVLNPVTGLRDTTIYPSEPGSEAAAREQIQSVIDQVIAQAASKEQEDWITPTLLNGWVNYEEANYQSIGYFKDEFGIVHLKGMIKSGTASLGTALFVLPLNYRPQKNCNFMAPSNDTFGYVRVLADGNVWFMVGSNVWIDLTGITFKAV